MTATLPHELRPTWLGSAIVATVDAARRTTNAVWPLFDLVVRLWLAQTFFVSGLLKLANWDTALYLAEFEYPVSWLAPATAAALGTAVELIGAVLLAVGLATRVGAAALLTLALVIQFEYRALDVHLLWIALLGWYVCLGAGPISLDRAVSRGLADSALPFGAGVVTTASLVTRRAGPVFQLALRLWLAASLVTGSTAHGLPAQTFAVLTPLLAGLVAVLLALGLGTRIATLVLAALLVGHMGEVGGAAPFAAALVAGLLALRGAGRLSLDALIERRLERQYPQLVGRPAFALDAVPRIVIVGAGFGGLACAARLARLPVQVTLVDRQNYHLFQPLLYQVATTALSPGDIAAPIRGLFREHFNVTVLLGTVSGVDAQSRQVIVGDQRLPYDYLVLATGAAHSYFGRDEWATHAPGLKRVEDAVEMRRRLLSAFERAEATEDVDERQRLLTFLVVGGGPTGVELAGAIAELARFGMEKDFRRYDPATARVILVQAGPRVLPTFPEALSAQTRSALEKLGVEVRVGSRVERIDDDGVIVDGERIASRTVAVGGGRGRVTRRQVARRSGRQRGPREGRTRSLRAGPAERLRDRRYGRVECLERSVRPRARARSKTGRRVRGARDRCPRAGPTRARALRVSAPGQPCHHRSQGGGRGLRLRAPARGARLVVLGRGARGPAGGAAQPLLGHARLVLGLSHVPQRHAAHHGRDG